jgi:hypothetical protein
MNSLQGFWVLLNKTVERHNENGKLKTKKNHTLENPVNRKLSDGSNIYMRSIILLFMVQFSFI